MTLQEWSEMTGTAIQHPERLPAATFVIPGDRYRAGLWWLDDYAVSTVSGPVVWLVPKD